MNTLPGVCFILTWHWINVFGKINYCRCLCPCISSRPVLRRGVGSLNDKHDHTQKTNFFKLNIRTRLSEKITETGKLTKLEVFSSWGSIGIVQSHPVAGGGGWRKNIGHKTLSLKLQWSLILTNNKAMRGC